MLVNDTYEERNVNSVTENQKKEVKEFLACLVRIWCLTTPEKSFTCAELLKILNNADWQKKPLCYMYDYYKNQGESDEKGAFENCKNIRSVVLVESDDTSSVSISDEAFSNYTDITFICKKDGKVARYAREHSFRIVSLDD